MLKFMIILKLTLTYVNVKITFKNVDFLK